MTVSTWLDDVPVLGALPLAQMAAKLAEMGDEETAEQLVRATSRSTHSFSTDISWLPFIQPPPWKHTFHFFGYLVPLTGTAGSFAIRPVEMIQADSNLQQARLKITLNRMRIADYPGKGTHQILLHCFAQNQVRGKVEPVHFNALYRVREGETAAIQGSPLFVGLKVGNEGIVLKCRTINIKNEQDETFLRFLDSEMFKAGVKLAAIAQPAIGLLSEMTLALTKEIAKRRRNVSVQDFELGLDFDATPMKGRLAEGAYLAVQMPELPPGMWDWQEWVYHAANGQIVKQAHPAEILPYNYLVFGVNRYQER